MFSIISHPFWGTPNFWKHPYALNNCCFFFPFLIGIHPNWRQFRCDGMWHHLLQGQWHHQPPSFFLWWNFREAIIACFWGAKWIKMVLLTMAKVFTWHMAHVSTLQDTAGTRMHQISSRLSIGNAGRSIVHGDGIIVRIQGSFFWHCCKTWCFQYVRVVQKPMKGFI